ncbi:hypothetical protein EV363DRAFT_1323294 [Boletus edulis]|jgi:hypothetical protein|uniref:Uncharacterized protein n=1 Tax=Boletus edulis BED1 TaxID=1328754 RepID=A0AAD4C173_BOLED|nr:hypothetical protein EV363DRAFT_1323294 [Boletus edulis]KAF8444935.1 hypothetical protein L210DRAFT_3475949 [Boletus edulis BED1]
MRLSILPILLAGVSVVSLVAAEPIRIIDSPSNANANIRFGLALANANVNGNDDNVARVVRPVAPLNPPPQGNNKGFSRHLCGASLREKAIRLSNAFRHALGMPLIEASAAVPMHGEVHIFPVPFPQNNVMPHNGHHGHQHKHRKSFFGRIHKAIKALGPWEGRAVAFVLGCGIGVLLRMFWVLSVLAYRTVRGERDQETFEPEYIVYEQIPETIFVAPPQYVDEKVKVEAHEEVEECK